MPKFSRILTTLAAVGALSQPAFAQDAATVIARVGEVEITLGHAIAQRAELPAQLQGAPNEALFGPLVDQLIDQEVLAQAQAGQLSLRDQLQFDNESRSYLANLLLQEVIESSVTEESLGVAYAAFSESFGQGEPVTEWNAAHILVREEEEMAPVVAALEEGRDFAEVAAEFSTDGSARQGGDLGWFGPGMMIPEFEEVVSALEPGQVSDPFESRFGWHVVRVAETRIASVPELDAVREELSNEIRREAVQALIERLRGETTVENLTEGLDPELLGRADLLAD